MTITGAANVAGNRLYSITSIMDIIVFTWQLFTVSYPKMMPTQIMA